MKRPYQKFLFFMCDRPAVDDTGDHRRQHLGKPKGVPCAVCAQPVTQQRSQRHDENDIPAQGDDQRFCALPSPSSAPETVVETAEMTKPMLMMRKAGPPGGDGFGVLGEQPHQLPGGNLTDDSARRHDGCAR